MSAHVRPRPAVWRYVWIVVTVISAAVLYLLSSRLLWNAIYEGLRQGFGISTMMKDWYLGDQLSYLGITSNVTAGIPAYKEPLMLDGSSIYPSGYYWLLGMMGKVLGLNAFAMWNLMGFSMLMLLMTTAGFWGWKFSKHKIGWLLGPLPVLVGTLEYWSSHTWRMQYGGVQAIQWPPYAILINPGAEQFTLTITSIILVITVLGIRKGGEVSWKHLLGAGVLLGLILNAHSYIPLLCLATVAMTLLLSQVIIDGTPRRWLLTVGAPLAGVGIAALHIPSMPLGRFVVVLAAFVLPLAIIAQWRQRTWKAAVCFFGATAVFSLPLMLRIANMARDKDSFFYFRQHLYDGLDFSIPMRYVFLRGLPVLALAVFAIFFLWRRSGDDHRLKAWIAAITAMLFVSSLLEWNAHWGFGQEPYRFFPYQMLLLTLMAAPWLVSKLADGWIEIGARVLVVGLLLATIPTTVQFYKDTKGQLLHISPQEQALFKQAAAKLPASGAVLTDICIPRKVFKDVTHAPVADIVVGLALPNHHAALEPVLAAQRAGRLSSNEELQAAGITTFLAMNYCKSPTTKELNARFGEPIAVFHLPSPEYCGLPADTTYSLYKVPTTGSTSTNYPPIDLKDPFGTSYRSSDAQPLPPKHSNCALTTY